MKIVCLGNEFVEEVGGLLTEDHEVVNIKDSFQLMEVLNSEGDFVLLDVAQGLEKVCLINVEDLRVDSILSAHDFDVGQVLVLLDVAPRIIGIPMKGDALKIRVEVLGLIKSN